MALANVLLILALFAVGCDSAANYTGATRKISPEFIILHATLQFLAFGVCAPMAALAARHLRNCKELHKWGARLTDAPGMKKKPKWLIIHTYLQIGTALFGSLGCITGVVMVTLQSTHGAYGVNIHQFCGVIFFPWLIIQAASGTKRPLLDSDHRAKWECFHKCGGRFLIVLTCLGQSITGFGAAFNAHHVVAPLVPIWYLWAILAFVYVVASIGMEVRNRLTTMFEEEEEEEGERKAKEEAEEKERKAAEAAEAAKKRKENGEDD